MTYFFSQRTQKNRIHRVQSKWWPLPRPLPRREGEWSPRYPYGLDVGCFLPPYGIFISNNALWTLYAEGVLWARNCAQKCSVNSVRSVREKNTLRERKNSPACCFCVVSYSGSVLFLTEKHRWTEHTAFHRDIKSTDFTEPYSHL